MTAPSHKNAALAGLVFLVIAIVVMSATQPFVSNPSWPYYYLSTYVAGVLSYYALHALGM